MYRQKKNVRQYQTLSTEKKRGRKQFYDEKYLSNKIYKRERCFAWNNSFRTLLIRFDTLENSWLNWNYLTFGPILLKV